MVEYKRSDINASYTISKNQVGDYRIKYDGCKPFYFSGSLRFRPDTEAENIQGPQEDLNFETIFQNVAKKRLSARQIYSREESFEGKKIYFALTSEGDTVIDIERVKETLDKIKDKDDFFQHHYGVDMEDLSNKRLLFLEHFLMLCGLPLANNPDKDDIVKQFKLRFIIK